MLDRKDSFCKAVASNFPGRGNDFRGQPKRTTYLLNNLNIHTHTVRKNGDVEQKREREKSSTTRLEMNSKNSTTLYYRFHTVYQT